MAAHIFARLKQPMLVTDVQTNPLHAYPLDFLDVTQNVTAFVFRLEMLLSFVAFIFGTLGIANLFAVAMFLAAVLLNVVQVLNMQSVTQNRVEFRIH